MTEEVVEFIRKEAQTIRRLKYRCTNPKCGAEDTLKLFTDEAVPPIVNCHSCRAGRGMDVGQMMQNQMGMLIAPMAEQEGTGH